MIHELRSIPSSNQKDAPRHYCCCSVTKSCLILWDPMDYSIPSSSVLWYLPEFAQIHVHGLCDAVYSSHPLLPPSFFLLPSVFPSIRVFSLWVSSYASGSQSIGASASASVLPLNTSELCRRKLTKEKKGLFLGQDIFFWGGLEGREWQRFYHIDCLFFLWGMERAHVADDLIGGEQKILE